MKKAIILVGSHFAGKSKTIRCFLKPKLGIGKNEHIFVRNGQNGFILSQSFEESARTVEYAIKKYGRYELLILSARPPEEAGSCLSHAQDRLAVAGYRVHAVPVVRGKPDSFYNQKADEIIRLLDR